MSLSLLSNYESSDDEEEEEEDHEPTIRPPVGSTFHHLPDYPPGTDPPDVTSDRLDPAAHHPSGSRTGMRSRPIFGAAPAPSFNFVYSGSGS
jgi:hypothetical protein